MNIHAQSQPLLSLENRDAEMSKEERGYPRALSSIIFWLVLAYGTGCSTYPAPAAPAVENHQHDRLSPPVLVWGLAGYGSWGDKETSARLAEGFTVWNLKC